MTAAPPCDATPEAAALGAIVEPIEGVAAAAVAVTGTAAGVVVLIVEFVAVWTASEEGALAWASSP